SRRNGSKSQNQPGDTTHHPRIRSADGKSGGVLSATTTPEGNDAEYHHRRAVPRRAHPPRDICAAEHREDDDELLIPPLPYRAHPPQTPTVRGGTDKGASDRGPHHQTEYEAGVGGVCSCCSTYKGGNP